MACGTGSNCVTLCLPLFVNAAVGTSAPLPCGNVTVFCPEGSSTPTAAAPGFYTANAAGAAASDSTKALAVQCPPGSYCSAGERRYCPAGTFQGGVRASDPSNCTACLLGGFFCRVGTASPVKCGGDEFYCPPGATDPVVAGVGDYTLGLPGARTAVATCPPGYFCPGSGKAFPCPPGRYGAASGLENDSCSGECDDGVLCPEGATAASGQACPVGQYCIAGVAHPCPSGTFNPTEGAAHVDECVPCPAGSYSPTSGAWSDASCTACPQYEGSGAGAAACWPGIIGAYLSPSLALHAMRMALVPGWMGILSVGARAYCIRAETSPAVSQSMGARAQSRRSGGPSVVLPSAVTALKRSGARVAARPLLRVWGCSCACLLPSPVAAIVASDPEPVSPGLSADDVLTVYWTSATNKPDVSTTAKVLSLLSFTPSVAPVMSAYWNGPGTPNDDVPNAGDRLVIILRSPIVSDTPPEAVVVGVLPGGGLRSGAAGAVSHNASIANVSLGGTWGDASQPRFFANQYHAAIALDYGGQPGLGPGDAVLLRFNQPVVQVPVGSKAALDALLAWGPSTWATNYTGEWLDALNLLVTVQEVELGAAANASHQAVTAVGALSVSVLASGNLTSSDGTSAPCDDTAIVAGGSWGDVVCDGGVVVRSHTSLVVAFMPPEGAPYVPASYVIEAVPASGAGRAPNVTVVEPGQSLSLPLPPPIPATALRYSLQGLSTDVPYRTRVAASPPTLPQDVRGILNRTVPLVFSAVGAPGEGCACATRNVGGPPCGAVSAQDVTAVAPLRPTIGSCV